MRASLERAARRWWAGGYGGPGRVARTLCGPLASVGSYVTSRRIRADAGSEVLPVPVVSVGNIAVGGTGKTPFVGWVVRLAQEHGRRVGVVTHEVARDEADLHRRWAPDAIVVSDRDRARGARSAIEAGADVIVLDDGFQHTRLARSLDIVLVATEGPFPVRTLPCGPYREPYDALRRADIVVDTCRDHRNPGFSTLGFFGAVRAPGDPMLASLALRSGKILDLDGRPPPVDLGQAWVLACAGIARPELFFDAVAERVSAAENVSFPDHHDYDDADARQLRAQAGSRPIVVTAKDAVKLEPFRATLEPLLILHERLDWHTGEDKVRNRLIQLFREGGS